ncbi:MAG: alginate export family protein [Acidobacteriota bacterium]
MKFPTLLATLCLVLPAAAPARGDDPGAEAPRSFKEAITGGDAKLSLRYRFESVDDDFFDEVAHASTLRTSLSYKTAAYKGWSFFIEAEDVSPIFDDDDYNNAGAGSLNNGVRGVPVVADPNLTEINQAWIGYQSDRFDVTAGRQEINLGDQRFVGAVAWRQNHQSFDGIRLKLKPSGVAHVDYSFVSKVHRIFGDTRDLEGHFLYAPIALAPGHKLTAYGFSLDFDDAAALSTLTYGLEYQGKVALGGSTALKFEAEAAQQDETGDNPFTVDTRYLLASLGADIGRFGVDVTWELLGERDEGDRPFLTPFATLHKFNGWADKFLQTPSVGLETLYLRFRGTLNDQWRFALIYHDFTSDGGDFDFGTELDGELVYKAPWKQTFALRFAAYEADDFSTDTGKVMLWSAYTF